MRPTHKPIRWTLHALYRAGGRVADAELARLTVTDPEFVIAVESPRQVYMRRYTELGTGRPMLIRAVVEETPSEIIVLSIYVTSKVAKYLPRTPESPRE